MQLLISDELFWLIMTIMMTSLFWIPYIVSRMQTQGVLTALWDPYGITKTDKKWAQRMMHAHNNAIENLAIFAPIVVIIQMTGTNSTTTATACMIYFIARMLHFVVFTFAVPVLRVVTFLTGFGACVVLIYALLAN